jgi:uncharacterized protein HemX
MTEQDQQTLAIKTNSINQNLSRGLYAVVCLGIILLLVWGGLRLNTLSQQIKKIEDISKTNSQQLTNFNQILGRSIDDQASSMTSSPADFKASIEIFEKFNSLIAQIDFLSHQPEAQPQKNPEQKNPVKPSQDQSRSDKVSANAEMRWWSSIGQYVFNPIKNYFGQLIQVQVLDSSMDQLAMTELSHQRMREEILMRLLTARNLLLYGQIKMTSQEVLKVKSIVEKNYIPQDERTQTVMEDIAFILKNLQELEKKNAAIAIGDKK